MSSCSDVANFHHGPMSREDCENLLKGQSAGTYLFRQRTTNLADHVLSVLAPSRFVHLMVKERADGTFATSRRQFNSLSALVASYPGLAKPLLVADAPKLENRNNALEQNQLNSKPTAQEDSSSDHDVEHIDLTHVYRYIDQKWRPIKVAQQPSQQQSEFDASSSNSDAASSSTLSTAGCATESTSSLPVESSSSSSSSVSVSHCSTNNTMMSENALKRERHVNELSFVTFNVWFDGFRQRERAETLFHLTSTCRPDVVCFQEVTAPFLEWLLAVPWVQRGYYVTSVDSSLWATWYGLTILSKHPIERLGLISDLETRQGRRFLYVDLRLNGEMMRVGTMHLESYDDSKECRLAQLSRILPTLAAPGIDHSLLLGDMNMCATWPENRAAFVDRPADQRHLDLWPVLRPSEPGWTENTDVNKMRAIRSASGPRHVRFDRVFLRSTGGRWKPHSIELLGTVAISHNVWPSDHFGLHARIRWHTAIAKAESLDKIAPSLVNAIITDNGSPRIIDACDQPNTHGSSLPSIQTAYDQGTDDDDVDQANIFGDSGTPQIERQESMYAADFADVPSLQLDDQ